MRFHNMSIIPVIMAGGVGSRLWPLSRSLYPKQFLAFDGKYTLLQKTINRLTSLKLEQLLVISNEDHRFLVAEQLKSIDRLNKNIILEPEGKNTAPAVALAALRALEIEDDPYLLVLAADHYIENDIAFCSSVTHAFHYAKNGNLVTFGIVPSKPETGYGYIKRGDVINSGDFPCFKVDEFVEKPCKEIAEKYLASNSYYWNSGIFLFSAKKYLNELKKYAKDIYDNCIESFNSSLHDMDFIRIDSGIFKECPSNSIDYAVMEHTEDAVVCPITSTWSDIGSWSAVWEVYENKDSNNNALNGDCYCIDTVNSYLFSKNRFIATIGVSNLVVIDTPDALLVAQKDSVQSVKQVVDYLKDNFRDEYRSLPEIFRPWGSHESIAQGERYLVKKVNVTPGQSTATQIHYNRAEHWVVVSGTARVNIDNEISILNENESIYIPIGKSHSFENPGKVELIIIEIRTGSYLAEDDVQRVNEKESHGY